MNPLSPNRPEEVTPMFMFRRKDEAEPGDVEEIDVDVVLPEPVPISVVTLAGELGEPVDQLLHRLREDVFVEEQTGLRCVSVETCRREVDRRNQFEADSARRMKEARARQEAARQERAAARPAGSDPRMEALANAAFTRSQR